MGKVGLLATGRPTVLNGFRQGGPVTARATPLRRYVRPVRTSAVVAVNILVVGGLLQVGTWLFGEQMAPPPLAVLSALRAGWSSNPTFALFGLADHGYESALFVTGTQAVVGVGLGAAIGIALSAIIHGRRFIAQLVDPLLATLGSVPIIALAPLLLLWFGMVNQGQIGLVALNSAIVMGLAVRHGLRRSLGAHGDYARALGAGRVRLVMLVLLPSILPDIVGALRTTLGFAWGLAAFAELLGGRSGLGQAVAGFADLQNVTGLVAVGVLLTVVGVVADALIVVLIGIAAPWALGRPSSAR